MVQCCLQIEGPLENAGNRCSEISDLSSLISEFKCPLISPFYCWAPHRGMLNVNGNILWRCSIYHIWRSLEIWALGGEDWERREGPGTESEAERRLLWFESRPEQSTWTLTQLPLAWVHTAKGSRKDTYESVGKIESSGMREPRSLAGSGTCLSHLMTWNGFLRAVSRQRTAGRTGGRLTRVRAVSAFYLEGLPSKSPPSAW